MGQVTIGLLNGYNKIVAFSLTSGDITLTFDDGTTITETPSAQGASATVFYRAVFDLTGQWSGFVRHQYTATQGGNSRTGTFSTLPSSGDDWRFAFQACDGPAAHSSLNDSRIGVGFWQFLRSEFYADSPRVAGVVHCDDFCYAAQQTFTSTEASVATAPRYTAETDDYLKAYAAALGLYDDSSPSNIIRFGHEEDRQFCYANFNIWRQWGDWEFDNDIGQDRATQDNITGTPTNKALYDAGKAAWDIVFGEIKPPAIDGANSNAWGFACGDAYICAPDYITHADWSNATPVVYGATQLTSIKTALNNDQPVKILCLGHGIRYLSDPSTATEFRSGSQHPLFNLALGEYQSLFTETGLTPPSLMDNEKTNGLRGILCTMHGDYHRMKVEHHQKAAYSGNAAENFWSFTQGGNNGGAAPFETYAPIPTDYAAGTLMPSAGSDTGLTELVYLSSADAGIGDPGRQKAGLVSTLYAAGVPVRMHVQMRAAPSEAEILTNDNQTVWEGNFFPRYGGNDAHDVDVEIVPMAMMAAGAGFM